MKVLFRNCGFAPFCALAICLLFVLNASAGTDEKPSAGTTRTYYIAAEEIEWDYAPDGKDMMMSRGFDQYAKVFTARRRPDRLYLPQGRLPRIHR